MIIRRWQESDRPFLRTLFLHARRAGWSWLDGRDWQLEDFDAATLDEVIWVAEEEGHRLGFASVYETTTSCITCLLTRPFRAKGSAAHFSNMYRPRLPAPVR